MKFIAKILNSIKGIIVSFILVLVIIFMINNREIVKINFNPLPIPTLETRMFILMLISFFLGLITAILIYSNSLIKSMIQSIKHKRQIEKLKSKSELQKE